MDNGTNVVLHVNCSSSQPVVGYSVTDHSGFAAIGAVTVEYTCTNASGYIVRKALQSPCHCMLLSLY